MKPSHFNYYQYLYSCGRYWANYYSKSANAKYAKTPSKVIKWILEYHFKTKIKI